MKLIPTMLLESAVFAVAATSALAEHSAPTATISGQPVTSHTHPSGPDAWRYRWCNGHWWYWLPDNRWTYWEDGRWIDFDRNAAQPATPARLTFANGSPKSPATSDRGYQPYSSAYHSYEGTAAVRSGSRNEYGPGWGWGNGWNGHGYSWRSNR